MSDSESKEQRKKRKRERREKREKLIKHDNSTSTQSTPESSSTNKQQQRRVRENDNSKSYDTNSPFQEMEAKFLVSLPPAAMANIPNALNSSMQNLLLKYSDSLRGVIISFRDIEKDDNTGGGTGASAASISTSIATSTSTSYGKIINEMPHIHYHIKCTVLVFNPCVGKVLKGKVNESFPSHVGLLIYELFNGMISADVLRKNGFQFDDDTHEWKKMDKIISIEDGMECTVDKLHECNGLISLDCKDPVFLM